MCDREDEYDTGHDGWDLATFCSLKEAKMADLRPEHMLALRTHR